MDCYSFNAPPILDLLYISSNGLYAGTPLVCSLKAPRVWVWKLTRIGICLVGVAGWFGICVGEDDLGGVNILIGKYCWHCEIC
jgi:hypothetical protein